MFGRVCETKAYLILTEKMKLLFVLRAILTKVCIIATHRWYQWKAKRLPTVVNNPLIARQFPGRVRLTPLNRNPVRNKLYNMYHLSQQGREKLLTVPVLGFAMRTLERKFETWSRAKLEELADTVYFDDANSEAKEAELAMRLYFKELFKDTFDEALEERHEAFERFLFNSIHVPANARYQSRKIFDKIFDITTDKERVFVTERLNLEVTNGAMERLVRRDSFSELFADLEWGIGKYPMPNRYGNMDMNSISWQHSFGPSDTEKLAFAEVWQRFQFHHPRIIDNSVHF